MNANENAGFIRLEVLQGSKEGLAARETSRSFSDNNRNLSHICNLDIDRLESV
jgi:hypothetical protein